MNKTKIDCYLSGRHTPGNLPNQVYSDDLGRVPKRTNSNKIKKHHE